MDALALLRLQIEWGADEALEDTPVDRLPAPGRVQRQADAGPGEGQPQGQGQAQAQRLPLPLREGVGGRGPTHEDSGRDPSPQPPPSRGGGGSPPPLPHAPANTPGTTAERAASAAGRARSLDDLRAALAAFDGCALRDTAANLVFAAGNPDAGLMLIGEPPAEAEDRSGTPFAGPDGLLLDRMLASVGLARDGLLLTPLIPWRPPGGRPPSAAEIAVCLPFLHRLIALAEPRRILLAGMLTARTLLGTTRRRHGLDRNPGLDRKIGPAWTEIPVPSLAAPIPTLVLPSPGMVARTPSARREAWAALRLLRHTLNADLAKT